MSSMRFVLLLCGAAAAYSLPIPEDNDSFSIGGDEADGKLKQTVCVTLEDNSTSIARDEGELRQIFLIKTILGRKFDSSPRQFKFKILTVDGSEEIDISRSSVKSAQPNTPIEQNNQIFFHPGRNDGRLLQNTSFENDVRRSTNNPRENAHRTEGVIPNTSNITDETTNAPDLVAVGSMKPQQDAKNSTSFSVVYLGQNRTEMSGVQNLKANSSSEVGFGSKFSKVNTSIDASFGNELHTIRPGIQESAATNQSLPNNATQNETRTNIFKIDDYQMKSTATKNENISTPLNSTDNGSTVFSSQSPYMNVTYNETSNNEHNMSIVVEESEMNSTVMMNGNASTPSVISMVDNGTVISKGLPVNVSMNKTGNDTKINHYNITSTDAFQTNFTTTRSNISNIPADDGFQTNFTAKRNGNLTLLFGSLTNMDGKPDDEKFTETTVTEYPTNFTFGDSNNNKLIGEMKNDSAFNSSGAPSRQDKTLFSDRSNVTISVFPNMTNDNVGDDVPNVNDTVTSSPFHTASGLNLSIFSEDSDVQSVSNPMSVESSNRGDFTTSREEENGFTQFPPTVIHSSPRSLASAPIEEVEQTTGGETGPKIFINRTEVDGSAHHQSIEAPQNGSTEYTTLVTPGTHGTTVLEQGIDWTRKIVENLPTNQTFMIFDSGIRLNNVTEPPEKFAGTESTGYQETFRHEDTEASRTTVTTEDVPEKSGNFSNVTSNGTTGVESIDTGEEQNTMTDVTAKPLHQILLNKIGKALTVGSPEATKKLEKPQDEIINNVTTESPQEMVMDKDENVSEVESPESTENPDEEEEIVGENATTISSPQVSIANKTGEGLHFGSPEKVKTLEEEQNAITEDAKTKLSQEVVTDTNGEVIFVSSLESTEIPDDVTEKDFTTGSPQDVEMSQGDKIPYGASIDNLQVQAENHDKNTDESGESIDAGSTRMSTSGPTTIQPEFQNSEMVEFVTATPSRSLQEKLKIENAIAPGEPSDDELDIDFPTEAPPKYSSSPSPLPTSAPSSLPPSPSSLSTSSLQTFELEEWEKFNNFTIVFPTRPSFFNRFVYEERPTLVPRYEFPDIYKRYDYPRYMQIVPLQLPRRL